MQALKEAAIETISKLPNDCTLSDIMYEINFIAQVYEGLEDANNNRMITNAELLKKFNEWEN